MKYNTGTFISGAALLLLLMPAITQAVPLATDIAAGALTSSITGITGELQEMAFTWLSSFIIIQFFLTNFGLLKSGADLEAIFGKLIGSLAWFSFCFYAVTNGPDFIKNVGNGIFDMAGNVAGTQGTFSARYMFDWGFALSSTLMDAVDKATGSSWFAKLDFMPSLFTFFSCIVIFIVSALIGFKIFMVKIELMLTIMMSPLSFSFLGLSALKDQGIAPFKSLISLVYRIMLLAVLVSAMGKVGDVLIGVFAAVDQGSATEVWNPVFAGLMVYALMGYIAFKSDAIAANLSSGTTNLGTADVATAAAMGAAAGAAAMTGGASVAAGAAKGGQPMGDFIKSLSGGGGSVSNASSSGAGATPAGPAPSRASMSMGSNASAASNKPPVRPSSPASSIGSAPPKPANASGSGQNASIGGASNNLEQKVDKLAESLNRPNGKGFKDHVSTLNDHMAREQASTHVSINTHSE